MADSEAPIASPAAVPITTGRWSAEEHLAFQDGLKQFGANWRAIQRLVRLPPMRRCRSRG